MVTHYDIHNKIFNENLDNGCGVEIIIEHDDELFYATISETEDGGNPKIILKTVEQY